MFIRSVIGLAALAGLWFNGFAFATTYNYTGPNYQFVHAPYTTAMSITGSFTTASPLPPNMPDTDIGPNGSNLVTGWSFNDGINSYTPANSVVMPQLGTFKVGTDGAGNIFHFFIELESPLPPHHVNDPMNAITLSAFIQANQSQGVSGALCQTLSGSVCASMAPAPSYGDSTSSGSFAPVVAVFPPSISKAFGVVVLPLNSTTSLSFTLTNPSASSGLTGVAFTDVLPAGLVVAAPNGLSTNCSGTTTAAAGSGSVSLSAGSLAASGTCTIAVNVTGTTAGVKNNSVTVTSNEGGTGNTSNASVTVVTPLAIAEAFGAAGIALNGTTSLTFTLGNPDVSMGQTSVAFTDSLPAGLVVATPNGLSNTCGGAVAAAAGSGSISLSGGTIVASSSCTVNVNVTGTAAGVMNNTTGNVTSAEGGSGGTASASLTVAASAQPASVPALGDWTLLALSGLLGALGLGRSAGRRRDAGE